MTARLNKRLIEHIAVFGAGAALTLGLTSVLGQRLTLPLADLPASPLIVGGFAALAMGGLGVAYLVDHFERGSNSSKQRRLTNAEDEKVRAAAVRIESELSEIAGLIVNYAKASRRYHRFLTSTNEDLSQPCDHIRIQHIVVALIRENRQFDEQTRELNSQLDNARREIAKLHAELSLAEQNALLDALTSAGNRRLFDEVMARETAAARQDGGDLSLVMADIDHFKLLNDTHGHQSGDQVLKQFAALLQENVKDGNTVARYGGEEFALILPGTDTTRAQLLTELVRRQIEAQTFRVGDQEQCPVSLTASFGIAGFKPDETLSDLIARADDQLYKAKENGRNRIEVDNT